MTFHPAPRRTPPNSWMILPLPRTGPSRRWRLQLMTKVRLSSSSKRRPGSRPRDSVSSIRRRRGRPRRAGRGVLRPRSPRYFAELGLIDRIHRAEPHRHRRELPELRHQARVIRRQRERVARRRGATSPGSRRVAPLASGPRGRPAYIPGGVAWKKICPRRQGDPARARSGSRLRRGSPRRRRWKCGRRRRCPGAGRGGRGPRRSTGRSPADRFSTSRRPVPGLVLAGMVLT